MSESSASRPDPFATLGVPPRYALDLKEVEKRYVQLARALHPDRYVGAGATERRAALEKASAVNEAWREVRDPVRRAEALFRRSGVATGELHEPKASTEFLMEVLELREELSEARASKNLTKVRVLAESVKERMTIVESALASGFAGGEAAAENRESLPELLKTLGELRYCRRFLDEVTAIEEEAME